MSSSRSVAVDVSDSVAREVNPSTTFLHREDSVFISTEEDDAAAFDASAREGRRAPDGAAASGAARSSFHSTLRIVIPPASPLTPPRSPPVCSPTSPPTAPQTATVLPQHPVYPAALHLRAARDPNVAGALSQIATQKSAVVLLNADVSTRKLRHGARGGARRSGMGASMAASLSQSLGDGSLQPPPSPRSHFVPNRGFIGSLSQLFQPKSKGKPAGRAEETASAQDDVELLATPACSTSTGARPPLTGTAAASSTPGGGDSCTAATAASPPPPIAAAAATADSTGSRETLQRKRSVLFVVDNDNSAGSEEVDRPSSRDGDPSSSSGTEAEQSEIGMERVLEDAAKVRGLRLTWLLYAMIVLVICLFVLIFLLISLSANRTIRQFGKHIIQSLMVATTNSAELLRYDLHQFFLIVSAAHLPVPPAPGAANATADEIFCSRIYRAPIAFALYDESRQSVWTLVCDEVRLAEANVPDALPAGMIASNETPRLVTHSSRALAAYFTVTRPHTATGPVGTFVVFLNKDVIGRYLFSNFQPEYSTATLQSLDLGVLLPSWTTSNPQIVLTTLTTSEPSYTAVQPTPMGKALQTTFRGVCGDGSSEYVWHYVFREGTAAAGPAAPEGGGAGRVEVAKGRNSPSHESSMNSFPAPYTERNGAWGVISRMALCSVLCADAVSTRCTTENPSATWFVIDSSLAKLKQESALNVVGAISIVAVVLFSFILLVAYIGISLPVHFLRYQLLRAVGSKEEKSGWEKRVYTMTRRFWISDLVSLVRAIHILSLCFRLNKKYVPEHVLHDHAKQLDAYKGRLRILETSLDEVASVTLSEDDDDEEGGGSLRSGEGGAAEGSRLNNISEFATVSALRREASQHHVHSGISGLQRDGSERVSPAAAASTGHASSPLGETLRRHQRMSASGVGNLMAAGASPSPMRRIASTREATNSLSLYTEDFVHRTQSSLPNNELFVADASVDFTTVGHMDASAPHGSGWGLIPRSQMEIRRDAEATILCVRVGDVDSAYLMDYRVALRQHRRIMRFLLSRMRHYKGAVFHRSGDCLAAAWNAFGNCYNHAEYAAACAQDIANAFAPYREQGLQVGIVLHQGTFVCGTVEDTKEAFVTAFGEGPRQAMALAELAAMQSAFSILITESVKQTLSAKFECLIVDVIRIPALIHYLLLFELGMPRAASPTSAASPQTPMSSALIVQYAKAFALFRNHEFKAALDGIQVIRQNYTCTARVQRLLQRLEMLSDYYRRNEAALPTPYFRVMPVWDNYELVAAVGGGLDGGAVAYAAPDEWGPPTAVPGNPTAARGGTSPSPTFCPANNRVSPTAGEVDEVTTTSPTTSPHVHGNSPHTPASALASPASNAGGSAVAASFALPEVLYRQVLRVSDEEISFKRELHDNIKRLGTPAQKSPRLHTRRANHPLQADSSANSQLGSVVSTPHSLVSVEPPAHAAMDSASPLSSLPPLPASMATIAAAERRGGDATPSSPMASPKPEEEPRDTGGGSTSVITALEDSHDRSGANSPVARGGPMERRNTRVMAGSLTDVLTVLPAPLAGLGPRLPTSPNATSAPVRHSRQPENGSASQPNPPIVALPPAFIHLSPPTTSTSAPTHSDPSAPVSGVTVAGDGQTAEPQPPTSQALSVHSGESSRSDPDVAAALARNKSWQWGGRAGDFALATSGSRPQARLGSFVSAPASEHDAITTSIIQSVGISLGEADGMQHMSVSFALPTGLPTQIVGKNGTTYMRSNRILGRGSFGCVYLGMDIHSGKLVAIKFLPLPYDDAEVAAVEAEVIIMQRVKDSHVVEFITYAFEGANIILVMECMMAGSLQNMISAFKIIPSATAHVFMRDVLRGLNKLHSMGVIHRDVKPQNVLLTLAGNCKISDFGASAWLHELARKEAEGLVLGTPVYLAPEAARGMPVETSDIWSCGIMFLQLITGKLPYPAEQLNLAAPILVYQIGVGGAVPVVPEALEELDAAFARACLQIDPKDRKTARELLRMPLFTL